MFYTATYLVTLRYQRRLYRAYLFTNKLPPQQHQGTFGPFQIPHPIPGRLAKLLMCPLDWRAMPQGFLSGRKADFDVMKVCLLFSHLNRDFLILSISCFIFTLFSQRKPTSTLGRSKTETRPCNYGKWYFDKPRCQATVPP